ncbi:hypothetical protein VNI00_006753 [Paramarasmius palmivorus]|uniref:C3H1-type domain-containing protein n=1 Tax=Paramarasmius palmivorus TaxID=297713 RepID=A0AAW0D809_9AGAR
MCINQRGCSFTHPFTIDQAEATLAGGWSPSLKSPPVSASSSSLPFPSQQPAQALSKRSATVSSPGNLCSNLLSCTQFDTGLGLFPSIAQMSLKAALDDDQLAFHQMPGV